MRNVENNLKNWLVNIKNTDLFFIRVTSALIIIGLVFAFSSSTYESYRLTHSFWLLGFKQFCAFVIGFILLVFFWNLDYKFWHRTTWLIAFIALVLMSIVLIPGIGKSSGGSTRWLDLGFFQFQPAEVAKLAVILLLTRMLARNKLFERKTLYYLIFSFILIAVVLGQPDLGSAAILVLLLLQLLFISDCPLWILGLGTTIIGSVGYFKIFSTPYQLSRIEAWLNPYKDPSNKGYNLIQSQYAFGLGNFWGVGLGNSMQKQGFLPIPHADFIFAIVAEEIGLIGVTAILVLFLTWALRGLYLINKIENQYGKLLGTAIILIIITQTLINLAVSVGLLPVTGVTLPFFSCGGTSLIVTLAMCGILFNILSRKNQSAN